MGVRPGVEACVAENVKPEVHVGGSHRRPEDRRARRDSGKDQISDAERRQHDVEPASHERAHTVLGQDDVSLLGRERRMDLEPRRTLLQDGLEPG